MVHLPGGIVQIKIVIFVLVEGVVCVIVDDLFFEGIDIVIVVVRIVVVSEIMAVSRRVLVKLIKSKVSYLLYPRFLNWRKVAPLNLIAGVSSCAEIFP